MPIIQNMALRRISARIAEGVPFIGGFGAGFTIGNNFEGELPQIGNSYQISDNITKVIGNHTTKFGIDLRDQRFLQTLYFDVNGDYSYFGRGAPTIPGLFDANDNQNLFSELSVLACQIPTCKARRKPKMCAGKSVYLFGAR